MQESPRVTFVGPGAIGLFYASRLARIGVRVSLVLRSDYEQVHKHGIEVRGRDATEVIPATALQSYNDARDAGPADLVIITLKTTANGEFQRLISPLLGPETALLTLQNGLGSDESLAELFGPERVLGGLSFIACSRLAPGVVECFHPGTITLGEFGRPGSDRARTVAALFDKAGIPCKVVDSLAEARWRKLVWNIPFNGLSIAAGGVTTDRILTAPLLAAETRALMDEVAAAAAKLGFSIPEKFILSQLEVTPKLGAYRPSSLIDWQAGREVEVEAIWGEPLRRALAAGGSCPRLTLLHALLRQLCR